MTVNVYRWPPALGLKNHRWTVIDPVQRSRSPLTGKTYTSAHGRRRRLLDAEVSVRASHGYGLMEGLIEALEGGVHKVRHYWYGPTDVSPPRGVALGWDVSWDVTWEDAVYGTPQAGYVPPRISLRNLTPSKRVARAGEFLAYAGQVRRIIADVTSSASGTAVALIDDDCTGTAEQSVNLPARGTGIFDVPEIPEVPWTFNSEGTVTWRFREVFTDEIGPVTELAPWGE